MDTARRNAATLKRAAQASGKGETYAHGVLVAHGGGAAPGNKDDGDERETENGPLEVLQLARGGGGQLLLLEGQVAQDVLRRARV